MKQQIQRIVISVLLLFSISSTLYGQRETVFDRKEHIIDSIIEVPKYPRYEEQLGIKGRYELVGNVNLWVEQAGTGKPVVLISGGPGTSHHYFHPHFQKAMSFAELIYYDSRGVGLSEYYSGDGYTILQAVQDLEKLREKLGYEKWVLFGLSFGGVVAQVYATEYPHRVMGMMLVSSALPMDIDIGIGSRQYHFLSQKERDRINQIYNIGGVRTPPLHSDKVNPKLQMSMLYNAFTNGDWKRRHLQRWNEEEIATYARYELVHAKNYYASMINDYFKYDMTGMFVDCPIPTLIMEGQWDLAYGEDKWNKMLSQFPKAQSHYFEGAGHIPYEDNPEVFFGKMRSFLVNLDETPPQEIDRWFKSINEN